VTPTSAAICDDYDDHHAALVNRADTISNGDPARRAALVGGAAWPRRSGER
jgi:hypothetical protein